MENTVSTELKFWKLALREAYYLDLIDEPDFVKMYSLEFYESLDNLSRRDKVPVQIVFDVMKNSELFAYLLREEVRIISTGDVPEDKRYFRRHWLSYLMDCLHDGYINANQYDVYRTSINFDSSEWSDSERSMAESIIGMIQFSIVHENPKAGQFIEKPSFELLMFMNDLEYV